MSEGPNLIAPEKCLFADGDYRPPLRCITQRPKDVDGNFRDQTVDAANNMRYAATLGLARMPVGLPANGGTAIIVGGAPSIKDRLEEIRELAKDPNNAIFAINWTHNWLIQNGIVPKGMLFFEIDAEPDDILGAAHPDVIYFVCSHCHAKTFDQLLAKVPRHHVMLFHNIPDCMATKEVYLEIFQGEDMLGGGVCSFLRSVCCALALGYRDFALFGVDQSYPDDSETVHVEGYQSTVKPDIDGIDVWVKDDATGEVKRFRTAGYLVFQVEEFKHFCTKHHSMFNMRVYGDGMLPWVHRHMWPGQYS